MNFFSVDLYFWGHPLGHLSLSCPSSPELLPLVFNVSQNYSHMLIQLCKATAKCSSSRQFWIREFICPRGWRKEKNYSVTFVLWWQKGDTIFFLFSSNWNYLEPSQQGAGDHKDLLILGGSALLGSVFLKWRLYRKEDCLHCSMYVGVCDMSVYI